MTKLRVAVLFGGRSSEHSISCVTAGGVLAAIDRSRFDVVPVGITRDGAYTLQPDDPARFALDPSQLPEVVENGSRIRWPESAASRELRVVSADGVEATLGDIDIVFPILHGLFGEDGTVQGMLELLGLPYVGSGVLASSLAMHKHYTKVVLAAAGIPVVPWAVVTADEWAATTDAAGTAVDDLGLPVFVKPARAGSSVGVSRVDAVDELPAAIGLALAEDDTVLIERAITGRELEIAVLGGRPGEPARASVAGEIIVAGNGFYDFDAKYRDTPGVDLICPAELSDAELETMRSLAIRCFNAIGAEGLARVDFFLADDGFLVNEVNTMPGFTPISMFPRCWVESGLRYDDLITELIEVGIARGARVG